MYHFSAPYNLTPGFLDVYGYREGKSDTPPVSGLDSPERIIEFKNAPHVDSPKHTLCAHLSCKLYECEDSPANRPKSARLSDWDCGTQGVVNEVKKLGGFDARLAAIEATAGGKDCAQRSSNPFCYLRSGSSCRRGAQERNQA